MFVCLHPDEIQINKYSNYSASFFYETPERQSHKIMRSMFSARHQGSITNKCNWLLKEDVSTQHPSTRATMFPVDRESAYFIV